MAEKETPFEEQGEDEEEAVETKEPDYTSQQSESTYETESPEVCGGGYPTPEDENATVCPSIISQELDLQHLVTCTFSISLALPLVVPSIKPWMTSKVNLQRSGSKPHGKDGFIPKMHRFYHMEYFLLPDDIEPRKLDLVLFGPAAKLYLEAESKAVKPWLENDQIWVSWNHSIEINVTSEFLMKLRDYSIQLRVWDLKDKVCSKARYSKFKGTLPHSDQDVDNEVKRMVLSQREFMERSEPKPSYRRDKIEVEEPTPQEKSSVSPAAGSPNSPISKHLDEEASSAVEQKTSHVTGFPHPSTKSAEAVSTLSGISISGSIPSSLRDKTIQEAKLIKQKHYSRSSGRTSTLLKSNSDKKTSVAGGILLQLSVKKKASHQRSFHTPLEKKPDSSNSKPSTKEAAALAAQARKVGIGFLELDLMPLLSGEKCVTSQLGEKSSKLCDAYLSFSVEKPIMSEKQKRELNPLVIRIKSARCLPTTPVPIDILQKSCIPVYCKYKFHDMPLHQTQGRQHGTDVFFKDLNVILLGIIPSGELKEYLRGPPMEIEVHDRDKKIEEIKIKPSLFGDEPGDSRFSDTTTAMSRYVLQNPMTSTEEVWHPYGIARISFADLLLGEKILNISAPIHCCSVQDTALCQGGVNKTRGGDVSLFSQLPVGHYVSSESYLKVRIEVAVPLDSPGKMDEAEMEYSPYGFIVYIIDYKNAPLLRYLLQEITEINAEALQLDSYPLHVIQKSLNMLNLNHKLSSEEISHLDIITGFHLIDGSIHLLVVEGFQDKALKRLWNKRIDRLHESKTGRLQIFYNSRLSFHQRLYVSLEAALFHVRLCKPLSSIMKQPLLYVRDMVPQPCFEALSRLDYLCRSMKLRDVIHHSFLPTAEMVMILSQEFGIPLAKDDLIFEQYPETPETLETPSMYFCMKGERPFPLKNYNEWYILRKRKMGDQPPQNHIQANIENINLLSSMVQKQDTRTIKAFPSDDKSIFNYSSQALNSAEIAKKLLRQKMAQVPGKRFAYNHKYLSGMFDPVDEDSALRASMNQSKKLWMTPEGFRYPGFKSSIESNLHPHMPDEARVIELQEKWQENFFNANNMKPVLDRDRWRWDKREDDFELYKKPPCETVGPLDTHREEPPKDLQFNTALKVHRCCPATELISSGPKASCQLARFQGLLKDKPIKLSLKFQPTQDIGILDEVIESSICKGFVPGLNSHRSLKCSGNIIPCYDRKHNLFKTLKGEDFRLICRRHSFKYKRCPSQKSQSKEKILPVDEEQEAGNGKNEVQSEVVFEKNGRAKCIGVP